MIFGIGEKRKTRIIGMELRDRQPLRPPEESTELKNVSRADGDEKSEKRSPHKFPTWYSLVVLFYCLGVFALVVTTDRRLPAPLTGDQRDRFVEARARRYLKQLASVGPRPAGSYENEVLAVDFLKREILAINERRKTIHKLTLDIQKPRGSFNLAFVDGVTHHYRDIQNVIVKFESGMGSKDALLLNCHFDSVPQSPGASDDAVSCAIMLEILDILAQSDEPLKHNVIFLFNGAEENMLPGSHGFITQHMWASEVRAFINLEACGAGGRELVFQSGPEHPWMIAAYGEAAPYPFASVIGQEIFQSGVIPGDTDFRIFRDYGNIPGLDIAYMKNGYVYHTKYDTEEAIPLGSIQRAGDNILAVVKHLADSEILSHTSTIGSGNAVFFDLLGIVLIHYPEWVGIVINLLVVAASIFTTYQRVLRSHEYGVSRSVYLTHLGHALYYQVVGMVSSFLSVVGISTFLDALGRPMSWYSRPFLILFLYMSPTVFAVVAVFNFALPRQKRVFAYIKGNWTVEMLYFEVSKLAWTLFTLVLTIMRVQSSFFCMAWVLFPMAGRLLLDKLYVTRKKDLRWLIIHLLSLFVPLILSMSMIYATFVMFIPIMGRSGSAINPDLLIGCKAVSMTLATISFLCPLVMVMSKPSRVLSTLYMTTLLTVILVVLTPLGFPYSGDKNNLAPHRSFVIHTEREFYDKKGNLLDDDAGYFIVNLDRNSPRVLYNYLPDMTKLEDVTPEQCQDYIYCGVPLYYPCSTMLRINNWIPTKKPRIYQNTSVELVTSEESGKFRQRLLFRARGPDHMGIFFSPAEKVKLVSWSFEDGKILTGPIWKDNRPTHFIFYSHGLSPSYWEFWLEFEVPRTHMPDDDILDMVVVGHFIHGHEMKSPDFKRFLGQFPDWSYPVGWTASLKTYQF